MGKYQKNFNYVANYKIKLQKIGENRYKTMQQQETHDWKTWKTPKVFEAASNWIFTKISGIDTCR